MSTILVTGGAGFIGSAVVREIITATSDNVVIIDKLTYAGNLMSLAPVAGDPRFAFERVDICNRAELDRVFRHYQPDTVMHLAAESHVDRSIDGPAAFIETNIVGTYTLLEAARAQWNTLARDKNPPFVSTTSQRMRSMAIYTTAARFYRNNGLCAQQSLFGLESQQRPSGSRPAEDLRLASAGH